MARDARIYCYKVNRAFFQITLKSARQGFLHSRLPEFSAEDQTEIAKSADFLGINHYIVNLVFPKEGNIDVVSYFEDSDTGSIQDSSWYRYVCTMYVAVNR